jgi:hypothetical protein
VDVSKDFLAKDYIDRWLGAKSTPVIEAKGYQPILGYQPELLKYLIDTYPKGNTNV